MQDPNSANNPPDLSKGTPPPNNPYQAPGSPPASPVPGSPVPGSPPSPAGAPGQVTNDVIGQSWEILKPQIGMWLVAALIYIAITGAFNVLSSLITAGAGNEPSAGIGAVQIVISLLSTVVGFVVSAGLMKMAIHHVRSGQAEIGKLFDIQDVIVPVLIAGIVVTIATALGFVLCIIPGVIMALGFSMTNPLIVDQKMDAIEAIKRSWETCKPHLGALFVLFLLLGLINIAGFCACGLGLFVTFPLTQIAIALTYRNLFGVGTDNPTVMPSPFPPPPIASPQ